MKSRRMTADKVKIINGRTGLPEVIDRDSEYKPDDRLWRLLLILLAMLLGIGFALAV